MCCAEPRCYATSVRWPLRLAVVMLGKVLLHNHHPNDVAFHALFFVFDSLKAVVLIEAVCPLVMLLNFQVDGAGSRKCADACLQKLASDSVVLVLGVVLLGGGVAAGGGLWGGIRGGCAG